MENKYYTPTIEEFHVGFEYEQFCQNPHQDLSQITDASDVNMWAKCRFPDPFTGGDVSVLFKTKRMLRVKYLDREGILELGWEPHGNNFRKGKFNLIWCENKSTMIIESIPVFLGEVKNKSELKRLMNQLNIK